MQSHNNSCDNLDEYEADLTQEPLGNSPPRNLVKVTSPSHAIKTRSSYNCNMCQTNFTNYCSYRRHLRMHMDGKRHICDVCGKQFFRRYQLNRHQVKSHSYKNMWFCNMCDKWLENSVVNYKHFQKVHNYTNELLNANLNEQTLSEQKFSNVSENKDNCLDICENKKCIIPKPSKEINIKCTEGLSKNVSNKKDISFRCIKNTSGVKTQIAKVADFMNKNLVNKKGENMPSLKQKNLQKKSKAATSRKFLNSGMCEKTYSSQTKLTKGKQTNEGKTFICKYCCHRFFSLDLLKTHILSHGSNPDHKCYLCGHIAATFSSLMTHFLKHSTIKSSGIGKMLKDKGCLKNSEDILGSNLLKEKLFCTICKKSFETLDKLKSHPCADMNEKNWYNCTYCGKLLSSLEDHQIHLQSHSSVPFTCPKCSAPFRKQNHLDQHLHWCPKSTTANETLPSKLESKCPLSLPTRRSARLVNKRHLVLSKKLHINESRTLKKVCQTQAFKNRQRILSSDFSNRSAVLSCNLCCLNFCSKGSLSRHKRMHSGKPWFICQFCGKFFFRRDLYIRHEKTVHKRKTSKVCRCYYCKLVFDTSSSLRDHVMVTHEEYASVPIRIRASSKSSMKSKSLLKSGMEQKPKQAVIQRNKLFSKQINMKHIVSGSQSESSKSQILGLEKNTGAISDSDNQDNKAFVYKCGRCSASFRSLQGLLKHFQRVHGVMKVQHPTQPELCQVDNNSQDMKTSQLNFNVFRTFNEIGDKSSLCHAKSTIQSFEDSPKKFNSSNTSQKYISNKLRKEFSVLKTNEHSVLLQSSLCTSDDRKNLNSRDNSIFKLKPLSEIQSEITVDEREEVQSETCHVYFKHCKDKMMKPSTNTTCTLCLKSFATETALTSHEQLIHTMVDWYQCFICDACGPRKKMEEHMLSHMYKVGTFIINSNEPNFEDILPYLPQNKQKKPPRFNLGNEKCNLKNLFPVYSSGHGSHEAEQKQEESTNIKIPHAAEMVPMKEVYCSKCSEVFKCLIVLLQHKCLIDMQGTFSCCINACNYSSITKEELLDHLKEIHYQVTSEEPVINKRKLNVLTEYKHGQNNTASSNNVHFPESEGSLDIEEITVEPTVDILATLIECGELGTLCK